MKSFHSFDYEKDLLRIDIYELKFYNLVVLYFETTHRVVSIIKRYLFLEDFFTLSKDDIEDQHNNTDCDESISEIKCGPPFIWTFTISKIQKIDDFPKK